VPRYKILKITNLVDKALWVKRVFKILKRAYESVDGGLLFDNESDLIKNTSFWRIATVNDNRVIAITVFKERRGQKLVALATDTKDDLDKEALRELIDISLDFAYMEVSQRAENFILKYCKRAKDYLIHSSIAREYLDKDIKELKDGYHYIRKIAGISKEKILLGTI